MLDHPDTTHSTPLETYSGMCMTSWIKQVVQFLTKFLMTWLLNIQVVILTIPTRGAKRLKTKELETKELAITEAQQWLTEANCKEQNSGKLDQLYMSF